VEGSLKQLIIIIWFVLQNFKFQLVYHTVQISTKRWIKTHHITASSITPHRLDNCISDVLIITHF